jgi:bud site selection protein 20
VGLSNELHQIEWKADLFCKTDVSRAARTRARKLDADQVEANLKDSTKSDALLNPNHLDIDKPGLGLFYCIECDRHFPSQLDREVHQRSKLHKRIAKKMQEEKAYTLEESLWAAGVGVDNKQRQPKTSVADADAAASSTKGGDRAEMEVQQLQ